MRWMRGCIFYCLVWQVVAFEPLTILGAVGIGAATYGYKYYCHYYECCDNKWIPADTYRLKRNLQTEVFGQHLVTDIVVSAIQAHFDKSNSPKKALTLSFHGWPGGGKNYVSQFIVESLFKEGYRSQYAHFFMGRLHFPLESQADIYKLQLIDWIRGNVTKCERSVFVFDEVDKMPRKVLDGIKPFLDYHWEIGGVNFRKATFIFLSNTGGDVITSVYLDLWKKGKTREEMTMLDFEDIIRQGAFNEAGGFHLSEVIESSLIDHYIPFLPMEEKHVKMCIRKAFLYRAPNPTDQEYQEVLSGLTFGPDENPMFSNSGCKRIEQKVATVVAKRRWRS